MKHMSDNSLQRKVKEKDNKSIFIDLDGEGWKFNSDDNNINIDSGLYFGKKNSFTDNQNIVIPDSETLNIYPLTISLWYNPNNYPEGDTNIFSKYLLLAKQVCLLFKE